MSKHTPHTSMRREALQNALQDVEHWLCSLEASGVEGHINGRDNNLQTDLEAVRRLHSRATSSLINVALIGAFSSGKSFLLSGLQEALQLTQVVTSDGSKAEKYIGLLPSAPTPTTACPATVVPVAGDHRLGEARCLLRVRFIGDRTWEDIVCDPTPATVAAYAMAPTDLTGPTSRNRPHWDKQVAEIEILLRNSALPAKLNDLPGYGSDNAVHDEIIRSAIASADCFIYVAPAWRSLGEEDLGLIGFLYAHYLRSRKPMLWVVTGIDRAMDLTIDDKRAWEVTVEKNNELLRTHFKTIEGKSDQDFIGHGFMPVSPAIEARARCEQDPADAAKMMANSRMSELRQRLCEFIESHTGAVHLAQVAEEARTQILPRNRSLHSLLTAHQLPLEELRDQQARLSRRLQSLDMAREAVRDRLVAQLRKHTAALEFSFRGLNRHLHTRVDPEIRNLDIRKSWAANDVDNLREHAICEFVDSPSGPATLWTREFASFKEMVLLSLRESLHDDDFGAPFRDFGTSKITIEELGVPGLPRLAPKEYDPTERAANIIGGLVVPVAGIALGILASPLILAPAGLIAGGVLAFGWFRHRRAASDALDALRQDWIADLDGAAEHIKQSARITAESAGNMVICRAEEMLIERRSQIARTAWLIEQRLSSPEYANRNDWVNCLTPLSRTSDDLLATLAGFSLR